jgi:hypothetical protein
MMAAVAGGVLATGTAQATNEPRVHDRGVFLRMSAGLGYAQTNWSVDNGLDASLHGLTGDANFAIGAIVGHNVAVHGSFWGWSMADPTAEANGHEVELDDVTYSVSAFGPGVTLYTNTNWYFSGNVGFASASLEQDHVTIETDNGFALDAIVGKEWWVGGRWGLGVAGSFGYHSIPPGDNADEVDGNLTGESFGVRFSATFN